MDTQEKLGILSADAQYDLSCACGDSGRKRAGEGKWLYPVTLANGGTGILLKTLLSNACSSDCRYCPLRHDGNIPCRCTLSPDEIARAFLDYNRRKRLLGLFLSCSILGTADRSMQLLVDTAELLRHKYSYRGYIHLKIIPGASDEAIRKAISLASAVSLNIETPGQAHFQKLSQYKDYNRDIIAPLKLIASETAKGSRRSRVRCTTQFIVGASDESDTEILRYMDGIYNRLHFERVYFSAYQAGLGAPGIPGEQRQFQLQPEDCLTREHRLYQADFLLRSYGFQASEIPMAKDGNLDLTRDPKELWAIQHPEFFPVRLASADREQLLRVPGLGPVAVTRILKLRSLSCIRDLAAIGIARKLALKAATYLDFS